MNENTQYVGWGTLALINANFADLKGRNPLWWGLASLLGGPLVTLAILLVRPIRDAVPEDPDRGV